MSVSRCVEFSIASIRYADASVLAAPKPTIVWYAVDASTVITVDVVSVPAVSAMLGSCDKRCAWSAVVIQACATGALVLALVVSIGILILDGYAQPPNTSAIPSARHHPWKRLLLIAGPEHREHLLCASLERCGVQG